MAKQRRAGTRPAPPGPRKPRVRRQETEGRAHGVRPKRDGVQPTSNRPSPSHLGLATLRRLPCTNGRSRPSGSRLCHRRRSAAVGAHGLSRGEGTSRAGRPVPQHLPTPGGACHAQQYRGVPLRGHAGTQRREPTTRPGAHQPGDCTRSWLRPRALHARPWRSSQRGEFAEALSSLARAVEINPENRALARQDPDLEALRLDKGVRQAVETLLAAPRQERRRTSSRSRLSK